MQGEELFDPAVLEKLQQQVEENRKDASNEEEAASGGAEPQTQASRRPKKIEIRSGQTKGEEDSTGQGGSTDNPEEGKTEGVKPLDTEKKTQD